LDSTTIDLCLSLFPWAKFRKRNAAVKLHMLLDLLGSIPSVVIITSGKVHDVRILDRIVKKIIRQRYDESSIWTPPPKNI